MPHAFPSHVEWLLDRFGIRLEIELLRQDVILSAQQALETMCAADPSAKKLAVQWLVERFLTGGYLWEDVRAGKKSKVHETLVAFGTHRHKLDGSMRHLSSHPTVAFVWKAVAPFLVERETGDALEPGIRERRRREKADARVESIILCERPGLTVAVPLTEAASKWWGRGTRWCTAAENDNAFADYNAKGPLIVVVLEDTKLQLFLDPRGGYQLVDASDDAISCGEVAERWGSLGGLITWAFSRCPNVLRLIPPEFRDRQACLDVIRDDGAKLAYVPLNMRDREMCLLAISQSGQWLHLVPEHLRDRDMCLMAVRDYGLALITVPGHLRDREVCLEAVRQNGRSLKDVPQALLDLDMYTEAVGSCGDMLGHVPHRLRTEGLCLIAVAQDGMALQHVSIPGRSREVCLRAVRQKGIALVHVPGEMVDHEMCMIAVTQDGMVLGYVPKDMLDRAICLEAVKQNGDVLEKVPGLFRDREVCLEAIKQSSLAFQHIPRRLLDQEMCAETVRGNGLLINHIPQPLRDRSIYLEAVGNYGLSLCMVPEAMRDRDMCIEAVRSDPGAIHFVPHALRDEDMLAALPAKEEAWKPEEALGGLAQALADVPAPSDQPYARAP